MGRASEPLTMLRRVHSCGLKNWASTAACERKGEENLDFVFKEEAKKKKKKGKENETRKKDLSM